MSFLKKIFDFNERELKRLRPTVEKINSQESAVKKLSNAKLKAKTQEFRDRLQKRETRDDILPEAFAVVREAAKRATGMRPYDVQLAAGIVLHQGKITEQKTGEGKTLSATLALYLNALGGKGAHLITVNDYLARRDTEWMGPIFYLLGLSVGCLNHEKAYLFDPENEDAKKQAEEESATPEEMELGQGKFLREVGRREAYEADIAYGTNNEFGFDYLRDNMVYDTSDIVQINGVGEEGAHHFAIVDEVDSILVDEARTPLIISAPQEEEATQRYYDFAALVQKLTDQMDFNVEEKSRSATLTEVGLRKVERMLGVTNLYERDFETVRHIEQALKARALFKKDQHYIVKDNKVIIVDEFTGRLMHGRRYSEGLHQAIEAKEDVSIQKESKTLATVSFQNYFRMYEKLAGMTGTAATESEEFHKIYDLDVIIVPTNEPMIRRDHPDMVYKTVAGKFKAVADDISERNAKGQPVLVGTTSIEKNELLSKLLKRKKISHELLNAKHHEKEAQIIARAGEKGAVTVATNMAGRGVDIKLAEGVVDLGGLHVIGTERHESRRIDNQLRGRSGRQGDPGSSRFFVALQDDLMRIFGGQMVENLMDRFGITEDVPLESRVVSGAIENAQKKVEGYNFDIRKHLVEYDDVMNKHREIAYRIRRRILEGGEDAEKFLLDRLSQFSDKVEDIWKKYKKEFGEDWLKISKQLSLQTFNVLWIEHIDTMEELRRGIGLAGYGGRDPLIEYKKEARDLFDRLINEIWTTIADRLEKIEIKRKEEIPSPQRRRVSLHHPTANYGQETDVSKMDSKPTKPTTVKKKKIGRNDPCWCNSGKKWKKCHYPALG
ncbi:MAG TPA: preprotein translocase subunit SecA [candidate division WWE3 bacterium]|uniref:Protein translocase subunit SecA n=1 Tax=candidate division WWE3 bacterium TaxID=2053526 RepID=A0A7C1SXN0_UNCKA|nr:preprotein translocase subunit SecA [candidate division WWE3 bacterium]